jgi:hypothetical protein
VLNATFNSISVLWMQSIILVEETRYTSTRKKTLTCFMSLTNYEINLYQIHLAIVRNHIHNINGQHLSPGKEEKMGTISKLLESFF